MEFEGTSGAVSFDNRTGDRLGATEVAIWNIVPQSAETDDQAIFDSHLSIVLETNLLGEDSLRAAVLQPLQFADGTTVLPQPLPPITEDMNLIASIPLTIGLSFMCIAMCTAMGWAIFTYRFRNARFVKPPLSLHVMFRVIHYGVLDHSNVTPGTGQKVRHYLHVNSVALFN